MTNKNKHVMYGHFLEDLSVHKPNMTAPAERTNNTNPNPQVMSLVGLSYSSANGATDTETQKKAQAADNHAK